MSKNKTNKKAATETEPKEDVENTTDVATDPEADETESDADELDTNDEEDESTDEVVVRYQNPQTGPTDRVFSRALHGDKFRALAKLFCTKTSGEIVK